MWSPEDIKQICVVGGGNASQVLAALLSNARTNGSSFRVSLLAPFQDESNRLSQGVLKNNGIKLQNPDGTGIIGMPDIITKDPRKALANCQIVIIPLPTFAMPPMLELIAPHLEKGTWVGAFPAQGGFQWIAANYLYKSKDIKIFGLDKLPYNCRAIEYGSLVRVFGYKEKLGVGCMPNDDGLSATMATTLSVVIPRLALYPVSNFLVLTLSPGNQCIHPARMYGLFTKHKIWDRIPFFYDEMDDFSANVIEDVSKEIQDICRAIERHALANGGALDLAGVLPVKDALLKVYEVEDSTSLARTFATCGGFRGIATPMRKIALDEGSERYEVDWDCRFFTEDIPVLCVLHSLAEMAGIKVDAIDKLILWAQEHMEGHYEFLTGGKLNENRKRMMYTPQYWGISSMKELLKFHGAISEH